MNREQVRKIAVKAYQWGSVQDVADALHAAYEAELEALRAQVAKREVSPSVIDLPGGWAPDPKMDEWRRNAARLASIKETARRMFASDMFRCDSKACLDMAESFESAFERGYGKVQDA